MENDSKPTIESAILDLLDGLYPIRLTGKEIADKLEVLGYQRTSVLSKLNGLYADKLVEVVGKHPNSYRAMKMPTSKTKNPLANIVSNAQAPKNPDTIEPMSDDEWQKEYNKIVRTRKWVQLPLEQMYSLIEDISDGLISLDDLGEIFIIYCKCIVESRKPTTEDSQNKLILRDVRELMKYDFVQTNEQYAYSVIVNKWHRGDKGVRAKANSHFKELEDRVKGLSDNKRAITSDNER